MGYRAVVELADLAGEETAEGDGIVPQVHEFDEQVQRVDFVLRLDAVPFEGGLLLLTVGDDRVEHMGRSGEAAELLSGFRHRRRLSAQFDGQQRVVERPPVDRSEGLRILSQRGEHVFRTDHRGALRRVEKLRREGVPQGEGAVVELIHPGALLLPFLQCCPVFEQPDQSEHPVVDGTVVVCVQRTVRNGGNPLLGVAVELLPDGVDGGEIEYRHLDFFLLPRLRRSFRRRQKRRGRQQGGNP